MPLRHAIDSPTQDNPAADPTDGPDQVFTGVAPAGWEHAIRRMKRAGTITNPWALAWWMKRHRYRPHAPDADGAAFDAVALLAQRLMALELAALGTNEGLGALIREAVAMLLDDGARAPKGALLYAEKVGGFQCRTCKYASAANGTHGHCALLQGSIHLDHGCCCAWDADLAQLQIHKEF